MASSLSPLRAPLGGFADSVGIQFQNQGGKGSHRNFVHPTGVRCLLSGNPGEDAHRYQEKEVRDRISEAQSREEKS